VIGRPQPATAGAFYRGRDVPTHGAERNIGLVSSPTRVFRTDVLETAVPRRPRYRRPAREGRWRRDAVHWRASGSPPIQLSGASSSGGASRAIVFKPESCCRRALGRARSKAARGAAGRAEAAPAKPGVTTLLVTTIRRKRWSLSDRSCVTRAAPSRSGAGRSLSETVRREFLHPTWCLDGGRTVWCARARAAGRMRQWRPAGAVVKRLCCQWCAIIWAGGRRQCMVAAVRSWPGWQAGDGRGVVGFGRCLPVS